MGKFGSDDNTGSLYAVISREPVGVLAAHIVEDAYARILQYETEGLLRIHRYRDLTDEQRRKDRNLVLNAIRRLDLLKGNHPL